MDFLDTDSHSSHQNQTSQKSVHWDPRWYIQTNGRTWRTEDVLFATMWTRLQKQ